MLLKHGRHHGTTQMRLDFDDFSILRQHYEKHFRSRPHVHEHAKIVTVFSGAAMQSSRNGDYEERLPGMHRFHPAGETHADRVGPKGWETLIIEFQPQWLESVPQAAGMFGTSLNTRDAEAYYLAKRVADTLPEAHSPASQLRVRGLAYELLAAFIEMQTDDETHKPRWLLQAHDYMREMYRDRPTLNEIAKAVNVHPVHLARTFRANYGTTVAAFMRELIMNEALELLRKGDRSITDIAESLGYTPSYFAELVHKAFGVKPQDLR